MPVATRPYTHSDLVQFHNNIASAHNSINGFYRFNINELSGSFRNGTQTPALLLESYSADVDPNTTNTANFNNKDVSFLILDFTGKADNYAMQDTVLDTLENIVLDIASYLKKQHKDRTSFLFGKIPGSIRYEKVGPLFDNMYGWNVLYTTKNHEPLCYDESKWTWE